MVCLINNSKVLYILSSNVPNSKCVSVMGQYKCNFLSFPNHGLIHFSPSETCVQSDFTKVRLRPSAKIMFRTVIERTLFRFLAVCSPFCSTMTVERLSFAPGFGLTLLFPVYLWLLVLFVHHVIFCQLFGR